MPFIRLPGVLGKVYVPGGTPESLQKHPCRDCFSCQMCTEERCRICRGEKKTSKQPCHKCVGIKLQGDIS